MKKASTWATIVGMVVLVVSNIWTTSAKFTAFDHRLQRLEEKIDDIIVELRDVKANDTEMEFRMNKAEHRIDALEKNNP